MLILGIETSCDDTGIAVLEVKGEKTPRFQILSNVIASQIKVHQKYGGVYPMLAKREHQKNLPITLEKALKEAGISRSRSRNIDTIAVTYGPGLAPCLWTGVNFAKDLAKSWGVPLIPTDHIEGHLLIGLLENIQDTKYKIPDTKSIFPAIALVVSGGHTQLVLVKDIGNYQIIGETRDDAAGECFDKTARILGLEYPGGPQIAAQAATYKIQDTKYKIQLPRPMMHTKDYDFSFSGLKTAVLYNYQARPKKERESKAYVRAMASEIQQAIIDVLLHKTLRAAKEYGAKSIILGGGVAANIELRAMLKKMAGAINVNTLIPPPNLATDNGLMIALAGYFTYNRSAGWRTRNPETIEAAPNLRLA